MKGKNWEKGLPEKCQTVLSQEMTLPDLPTNEQNSMVYGIELCCIHAVETVELI
jgi:hypothetical protein